MTKEKLRLCSICARGGSKGVPNKNLRTLLGEPLIVHSIRQAQQSGIFAAIAVSSDSDEILQCAEQSGVEYLVERPAELASDLSAKVPAIQHCARTVEERSGYTFQTFVDLDATSPLRTIDDIVECVRLLEVKGIGNILTVCDSQRSPYFTIVEVNDSGEAFLSKELDPPVVRRQDAPQCYDMNGSIYVWSRARFFESESLFHPDTLLFEMPEERSRDIDTEFDFEIVQYLANKRGSLT